MHLTHPANTLGAEINLAAQATILRKGANGSRITEPRRLACGSTFGDANRSSDPTIGQGVNLTVLPAQAGATPARITLANPVGLYMNKLIAGALTDDEGNPLDDWFHFERGVAGRGLMAIIEPPAGASIGFDKVQAKGVPLTRGGQLAEVIQMVLYARTAAASGPAPALGHAVTTAACRRAHRRRRSRTSTSCSRALPWPARLKPSSRRRSPISSRRRDRPGSTLAPAVAAPQPRSSRLVAW